MPERLLTARELGEQLGFAPDLARAFQPAAVSEGRERAGGGLGADTSERPPKARGRAAHSCPAGRYATGPRLPASARPRTHIDARRFTPLRSPRYAGQRPARHITEHEKGGDEQPCQRFARYATEGPEPDGVGGFAGVKIDRLNVAESGA